MVILALCAAAVLGASVPAWLWWRDLDRAKARVSEILRGEMKPSGENQRAISSPNPGAPNHGSERN
jgi:hypothetical protein